MLVTSANNDDGCTQVPPNLDLLHSQLRAMITNPHYPCAGAKASFNNQTYRLGFYPELGGDQETLGLFFDLEIFAKERTLQAFQFMTFIALFEGPIISTEKQFEALLWLQLQKLHAIDASIYTWDPKTSDVPDDGGFSFSIAGKSYFVVGLHPASSRLARRFSVPTLVFNPHDQFEALRAKGTFSKMKAVNRSRDLALQGSINPNLADFSTLSEARQYSGKPTADHWICPFRSQHRHN